MLDRALRPTKDRILVPVSRSVGLHMSPTAVTLLALATGLLAAALLFQGRYGEAMAAWVGSRILDGLDGTIARTHQSVSDFGGYLDLLCDFVVYAAIPTALVLGRPLETAPMVALLALLAAFYVNAASWMVLAAILEKRAVGAAARMEQTSVTMPSALIEGSETIAFYSAFILLPEQTVPLFVTMAVLVAVSSGQRVVWAWRNLR